METNEKQVSNNIKALIKKYGLTSYIVADRMHLSRATISSIINRPFKYDVNRLNDVANAIGCNINEFFMPL